MAGPERQCGQNCSATAGTDRTCMHALAHTVAWLPCAADSSTATDRPANKPAQRVGDIALQRGAVRCTFLSAVCQSATCNSMRCATNIQLQIKIEAGFMTRVHCSMLTAAADLPSVDITLTTARQQHGAWPTCYYPSSPRGRGGKIKSIHFFYFTCCTKIAG
jgi:hypothetical protein